MTNELAPAPIIDNSTPWVAEQIREYVATDGAKPTFRYNAPLLLLTTRGRKTGEWRRTCLIYGPDGDRLVIVASLGGAPTHPVWYLNLTENPRVWVQVGAESFWAIARDANADEKPALWEKMVGIYPDYADYQVKTDREIPVVVLDREN
jgi:deazaflavin-dependent oxidoreductase (nitroreductase family)